LSETAAERAQSESAATIERDQDWRVRGRDLFRRRRNIAPVRVTLNGRKDTAHIYLKDFKDEEVAHHYILVEHDVAGDFKFEFDKKGRLLGIEVKFASARSRRVF
jgi:uncharacterized protein YuzE